MRKKKLILYLILVLLASGIAGYVLIQQIQAQHSLQKSKKGGEEDKIYKYKLSGNVLHKNIESTKPLTYRELLYLAQVKSGSDLDSLKLDDYATEEQTIFIPRKDQKLLWSDIRSAKDFEVFGIDKKYARYLYEYKEKNQGIPTWDDILKIKGIGSKTIEILKSFLILE
ncbi:MAG0490 family ComEA-like DNA-binding protein [Mycoplasma seminis]|uniref:Helix-hairpin-helix domain-containing protein n=1 Tax=Mycoplasma seminis TaxID=512749 RepID=A0ABY9HAX7_9MOLU|nr:helix-hairpin-helix domain-containing protein [Mycoplasma seminis]WLP85757.1 helix-hairpin-helix domain-containing protein [Mycoplasma seminis]